MTKREEQLCRRYAKAVKLDPKLVLKSYEHGDKKRREEDHFSMKAMLFVYQLKRKGIVKFDEKGEITKESLEKYNELCDTFVKSNKVPESIVKLFHPQKPNDQKVTDHA